MKLRAVEMRQTKFRYKIKYTLLCTFIFLSLPTVAVDLWLPLYGDTTLGCTQGNGADVGGDPICDDYHPYSAYDFYQPLGTAIRAANQGTVERKNNDSECYENSGSSLGNYIVVKHADDTYVTYAHMQYPSAKNAGEPVFIGETIGYVGFTGTQSLCASENSHLHMVITPSTDIISNRRFERV